PLERGALAVGEAREVHRPALAGEVAEAQLLQGAVRRSRAQHVLVDLPPDLACRGHEPAHRVGGRRDARHSSPCPTAQVLMRRCCPYVTAMNDPSSTICASLKWRRSSAQSASSTPSGSQTSMLVYLRAAFCCGVKRSERSKC